MKLLKKIVLGTFVGALVNGIGWFLLGVLDTYLFKNKFEVFVPVTAGVLGAIIGTLIGSIIGLMQPRLKRASIGAVAIALLFLAVITPYFFSSPENKYLLGQRDYWHILLNFCSSLTYLIIPVIDVLLVTRIVTPKNIPSS